MKISYNWLKEYLKTDKSAGEISEILTGIGLEVESLEKYESIKGGLEGFIIGEVVSKEKHPDADRLSLTKVDVGTGNLLDIVCGAPNVDKGQKVVVATVGTIVYKGNDSFEIKKSKIRGAVSEGMICAEDEIGIGESHDGILVLDSEAKIGTLAKNYFNIYTDYIFEIGLTPNRIDAASHFGVARDLYAYLNLEKKASLHKPIIKNIDSVKNNLNINVSVENHEACPRYSGVCISNVTVKDSPEWLKNKLKAIGLRPINNIVDITNFVLHEMGQPLHAFDYDKISGNKVVVKTLEEGDSFTTLDEQERKLSNSDLMICNEMEGMCIAGVFGGVKSGVTFDTKNIFLESAYFNPSFVRRTSKKHNIFTDSSFRFERGVDPNNTVNALIRAVNLICEISGGDVSSSIIDIYPEKILPKEIEISVKRISQLIGKEIPKDIIVSIFNSQEIEILKDNGDILKISVPTYKVDVYREADIVEEILRIYGFNNVEIPIRLNSSITYFPKPDKDYIQNKISDLLSFNGFNEIMCNSLTKSSYYNSEENVKIFNPLSSDLDSMRESLLQGGLETIANNLNRKSSDLKLYEFGYVYKKTNKGSGVTEKYNETYNLSIFTTGKIDKSNWITESKKADFYYLKSISENIINLIGIERKKIKISEEKRNNTDYALIYYYGDFELFFISKVEKALLKAFGIKEEVYYSEFKWNTIIKYLEDYNLKVKELTRFPEVRRDLALILDKSVKYDDLYKLAFQIEKNLLKDVTLFDVYEGEKIPSDKKSYAISFSIQDENKTLEDKQIEQVMEKILSAYKNNFGAKLR